MALFEYIQVSSAGQESRGVVDAPTLGEARRRLRAEGVHVAQIVQKQAGVPRVEAAGHAPARRVSARELSATTRQLAVVMQAGMPLVSALSTLVEQLGDSYLGRVFARVRDGVNEGVPLAKALAEYPAVFPEVYVNMVQAGEAAGTLEEVLARLADLLERRAKLTGKVKGALAYPLFMVVVGSLVVVFILSYVLPSITKLFLEMKMRLPWPTVLLMKTSGIASHYFWVFAILFGALLGANAYWKRTRTGRKSWDRFRLRCPLLGDILLKVALSRFSRTLGVLLASGVSIVEALRLAGCVAGNVVIDGAVTEAASAVSHGEALARSLAKSKVFPPLVVNMVAAGEQSGTLEDGLLRVADLLDTDVEAKLGTLTALLEPLMILILGVIVGFIVLAMLLPIFDINRAIA